MRWRGRVKKQTKMSKIQIRTFENPWGGLNFSKMSELLFTLRPHPRKEKLKHLICPFSMQICLNKPFKMLVWGEQERKKTRGTLPSSTLQF